MQTCKSKASRPRRAKQTKTTQARTHFGDLRLQPLLAPFAGRHFEIVQELPVNVMQECRHSERAAAGAARRRLPGRRAASSLSFAALRGGVAQLLVQLVEKQVRAFLTAAEGKMSGRGKPKPGAERDACPPRTSQRGWSTSLVCETRSNSSEETCRRVRKGRAREKRRELERCAVRRGAPCSPLSYVVVVQRRCALRVVWVHHGRGWSCVCAGQRVRDEADQKAGDGSELLRCGCAACETARRSRSDKHGQR